jgi:hypothetical protein
MLLLLTTHLVVADANLTIDEVRAVRDAVYNNNPRLYSPDKSVERFLEVPKALTELYKQNPGQVLDTLSVIMEGGNPKDSILAAGYALELLAGPGHGTVCVDLFDKGTYDSLDKGWKTTPRLHWINRLKKERKSP